MKEMMPNNKDSNQTDNLGWLPFICVLLLVVFMVAVWFLLVAVEGSGPLRVRRSALLPMLGWVALAALGIAVFIALLRSALDKAIQPHDDDLR